MDGRSDRGNLPLNVIATVALALVVAVCAGVAFALPGKNSVHSGDIRKNAVKAQEIARGAVGTAATKDGSIPDTDVAGFSTNAVARVDDPPGNGFTASGVLAAGGSIAVRGRCEETAGTHAAALELDGGPSTYRYAAFGGDGGEVEGTTSGAAVIPVDDDIDSLLLSVREEGSKPLELRVLVLVGLGPSDCEFKVGALG